MLEEGRAVVQETRRWDDNKESSKAMRSKEDARDYRYFPDPDLPPVVDRRRVDRQAVRGRQPELKTEKMALYGSVRAAALRRQDLLTSSKRMADLFEETVRGSAAGPRRPPTG